jgi:hypothetical protein
MCKKYQTTWVWKFRHLKEYDIFYPKGQIKGNFNKVGNELTCISFWKEIIQANMTVAAHST